MIINNNKNFLNKKKKTIIRIIPYILIYIYIFYGDTIFLVALGFKSEISSAEKEDIEEEGPLYTFHTNYQPHKIYFLFFILIHMSWIISHFFQWMIT